MSLAGASKSFKILLKGVMDNGVHPIVVLPDKGDLYKELKLLNIPMYVTTYRPNTYTYSKTVKDVLLYVPRMFARLYVNHKAVKHLANFLKDKKIDLIHTNVSVINIGFKVSRVLGIPHVYHIREYGDKDFHLHYFPNKAALLHQLEMPDSYSICITKDIQEYHKQIGKAQSRVIYNGICSAKDDNNQQIDKDNYFLYVGRLEKTKGIEELIDAFAEYIQNAQQKFPLYILGTTENNSYEKKLKDMVCQNNIQLSVHFLGERKDVDKIMQKARAIIISSYQEAFGRCMAEAMFNRCLVVARDSGGLKEQFDNALDMGTQEIGLRFQNKQQLVDHLCEISSKSNEYYNQMIEKAFSFVHKLYTIEAYISQIEAFYQDILNHRIQ